MKRVSVRMRWQPGLLLLAVVAAGCSRDEIKVYRIANDQSETASSENPMPMGRMPGGQPDTASAMPRITWKSPAGWTEVTPGQMRVASFNVKGADSKQADVSVIPLPGMAGGDAANVNRWRGQVGLQPRTPDELKRLAEPVKVAGEPAELYDLVGKNAPSGEDTRILAVIQHRNGVAWFFKMTGDDQLVAQQKPAFVEFLNSIEFEAPGMPAVPGSRPSIDDMNLPAGHPDISVTAAGGGTPTREGQPEWQVPVGWKEVSAGQFLLAKFTVSGNGGAEAVVNVSKSGGDGGGLVANVNRWRRQLGLGAISGDEVTRTVKPMETSAGTATTVEMSGTDARSGQPSQLVAVIVPEAGQTWFYKLMGDGKVVESQKDAFTKFVKSVKY